MPADAPRRGELSLIVGAGEAPAAHIDKWIATARAEAARRGIELHVQAGGEFELRRAAFVQRVVGRDDLATALRLLGIQISEAPK